jgi:alcohol dehydrogenase
MDGFFAGARSLLRAWKGGSYLFGRGVLDRLGGLLRTLDPEIRAAGALLVCNTARPGPVAAAGEAAAAALGEAGFSLAGGAAVPGASPNTPRSDVYRIETHILHRRPGLIVAVGGGSTIDACKAANFLAALGGVLTPELDPWFGTGLVSGALKTAGKELLPLLALETAASSASHLTRYSNVSDPLTGRKKLIADEALTPPRALFDYDLSAAMPPSLTIDGVMDTIAHCVEVFTGLPAGVPREKYELAAAVTETALELTLRYAPAAIRNPSDPEAREALGLASDLGGYAIMVGGTHGPHVTSFSLVDLAGHGTACGIMNPYYLVYFAPAIEGQLRLIGGVFRKYGYTGEDTERLSGRALGLAVAGGMGAFAKALGAPATLGELPGWNEGYVEKILADAKDPRLDMKLKNMPLPLSAAGVDRCLGPVIRAAVHGDFSLIGPPAAP